MSSLKLERSVSELTPTPFSRELESLERGDGIGVIDALRRALEEVDADIAVECSHTASNDDKVPQVLDQGPVGQGYGNRRNADITTAAINNLLTTNQVEMALAAVHPNGDKLETQNTDGNEDPTASQDASGLKEVARKSGNHVRRRKSTYSSQIKVQSLSASDSVDGNKSSAPFSRTFFKYFATVGSTREKRLVAISAWVLSVISLLVCLVLVTRDFQNSQKEAMSSVEYIQEDAIYLPTLFVCSIQTAFPFGWDEKNQNSTPFSRGAPSQWVESLRIPGISGSHFTYPETHRHQNIEAVVIDRFGMECSNMSFYLADPEIFLHAIHNTPSCFHCVKVNSDPPVEILRPQISPNSENIENSSLSIQVAQSAAIETCRMMQVGLSRTVKNALIAMVLKYADELQDAGILDFSGVDPASKSNDFGMEHYSLWHESFNGLRYTGEVMDDGTKATYIDILTADVADMLCNTVLFSGFWYPKADNQDVSFRYDTTILRWVRSGGGPYFPLSFSQFFLSPELNGTSILPNQVLSWKKLSPTVNNLIETTLNNVKPENELRTSKTMRVFMRNPEAGAPLSELSALPGPGTDTVFFQKTSINNVTSFETTSQARTTFSVDGRNANYNYHFRFEVRDFVTLTVSDQVTVQITSFLADFFGLIGLFLDLSVYTLIISPILVATKRRVLMTRARDHAAASI